MPTEDTHVIDSQAISIYRQYRVSRNTGTVPVSKHLPDTRKTSESSAPTSIADEVYRHYQSTRAESPRSEDLNDCMTDEIMSFIRVQEALRDQQPAAFRPISVQSVQKQKTREEKSMAEQLTPVQWFIRSSKNNKSFKERLSAALPLAAVVAMIAVLLMWASGAREVKNMATSVLASHALESTTFIDQRDALTLGFSTAHSLQKRAFGRGVLSANIGQVALSGNTDAVQQFDRKLDQLLPQYAAKRVTEKLNAVHSLLSSIKLTSDKDDHSLVQNSQVISALDDLRSAIRGNSNYPESAWFDIGAQLQAVYLSARLDRDRRIEAVLQDSLERFAVLNIPDGLPASRPLNTLRTIAESPESAAVDEVLSLCEAIKVLMS